MAVCWFQLLASTGFRPSHYDAYLQTFKSSAGSKYEVGIFLPPIIRFLHKGMTVKNKCATFKLRGCIIHDSAVWFLGKE